MPAMSTSVCAGLAQTLLFAQLSAVPRCSEGVQAWFAWLLRSELSLLLKFSANCWLAA